ncbi:TIGR03767 family metallophosphoesterase [Streptomyces xanthophaeus]|uniref:TIGR03767 family metallophosphoesterase n=1 Tax=Streptomyces xanthophaeus TaxID=67385 RepID=UPI0036ABEBBA
MAKAQREAPLSRHVYPLFGRGIQIMIPRRRMLIAGSSAIVAAFTNPFGILRRHQPATSVVGPWRTTLEGTLKLPERTSGEFRKIALGAPEPHTLRANLYPAGWSPPVKQPLLAFAQMTDLQIVDDQSPARFEFLDRMARYASPYEGAYPTKAAYRPQEMLSTQMSDAICRALRNVGRGPKTDLPFEFTIVTGDMVDNCQYNETRWYINLLDGEMVHPNSGSPTLDHSVSGDAFAGLISDYWHPQLLGSQKSRGQLDRYFQAGFPEVLSLPHAARRPFQAAGLGMPWYAAIGNHDLLVQGNALPETRVNLILDSTPDLRKVAVGNFKASDFGTSLPYDLNRSPDAGEALTDYWGFFWAALDPMPGVRVPADPNRRLLSKSQFIAEHFNTTGLPHGHGFTAGGSVGYYEFNSGPEGMFNFICLDTVRDDIGGARGAIDRIQYDWLRERLIASSSFWVERKSDGTFEYRNHDVFDRLIVIYCHHTLETMTNDTFVPTTRRTWYDGEKLRELLECFPNVILMVNGHTHENHIWAHERNPAIGRAGGFWEVNTASHIDWPIQSRILEVAEGSGVLSIYTTMVDADAPVRWDGTTSTARALASLGRELAANDLQKDANSEGESYERNAELLLPMPFELLQVESTRYDNFQDLLGTSLVWQMTLKRGQGPVTWNVVGLPTGLSFDVATGLVTGTVSEPGSFTVTYGAMDRYGRGSAHTFIWTVNIKMPNLAGKTVAQARAAIEAIGLVYDGFDQVVNTGMVGKVTRHTPVSDALILPGTSVRLLIGKYPVRR